MLIYVEAVACVDRRDQVVGAVGDLVDAHPDAACDGVRPLPPGQHRLSAIALDAEIRCLVAVRKRVEPDRTALAVDDLRTLLSARSRRPPWGYEHEPRRRLGAALKDGDSGWLESRSFAPRGRR